MFVCIYTHTHTNFNLTVLTNGALSGSTSYFKSLSGFLVIL